MKLQKKIKSIHLNQIGSFYNFPNWRYLIYADPSRANLAFCRKKTEDGSSSLNRYIVGNHEQTEKTHVFFSFSPLFKKAVNSFNINQKNTFYKLFNKNLKLQGYKKLFSPAPSNDKVELWNNKYIDLITDKPLKNFLKHVTRISYDANYDFAIKFRLSPQHQRNFCVIGYCIFAGLKDHTIAKRFKLFKGQVKALRELFFDFTHTPTEVVARTAYFTQLCDNNIISDTDRRYYKIIGSLGELGLKADADPSLLTTEEKDRLNGYLADSMLDNVTSLYFTIEDKKDALAYNAVINNLATFFIKKEEINYFKSKVRNLDASTTRIINERTDYTTGIQDDDIVAMELISKLALKENPVPEYKTISELK